MGTSLGPGFPEQQRPATYCPLLAEVLQATEYARQQPALRQAVLSQ